MSKIDSVRTTTMPRGKKSLLNYDNISKEDYVALFVEYHIIDIVDVMISFSFFLKKVYASPAGRSFYLTNGKRKSSPKQHIADTTKW